MNAISSTRLLSGLEQVAAAYDGFILDLWGVIHDGNSAYPTAEPTLQALRRAGKRIVLLSNAPRRGNVLVEQMERMGIARHLYDEVMSSGEAVRAELLKPRDAFFAALGRRCHHMGPTRDRSVLEGVECEMTEIAEADWVLNTGPIDFDNTLEDYLPHLDEALARNLPMVCANPDIMVIREGRKIMCAGMLARRYEEMGGKVATRGKPDPAIYGPVLELLGVSDKSRVLAVGDAFHTDIAGALGVGINAALVTGGIHAEELGVTMGQQVDPARFALVAQQHGETPTFALPAFVW